MNLDKKNISYTKKIIGEKIVPIYKKVSASLGHDIDKINKTKKAILQREKELSYLQHEKAIKKMNNRIKETEDFIKNLERENRLSNVSTISNSSSKVIRNSTSNY